MKTVIQSFLLNEMKQGTWLTQTFFWAVILKTDYKSLTTMMKMKKKQTR